MKPVLFLLLLTVASVQAQVVVFRSNFEYPNVELPTLERDAAALNGALEQVGLWSGDLPTGLGDAAPDSAFFRVINEDHFLLIDRPEEPFVLTATLSEAVPIANTRVSYQFSVKRVGGHAKDFRFVGLDAEGRESFHVVVSANNNAVGELSRLGVEANQGELIWDLETVDGEDSDGDFPFNNSTGNINNVGTVILEMKAEGFTLNVSKGSDNFLYETELLPYNDPEADALASIEIRGNGGATGISTGMWLDDLEVVHTEGVSDPGFFAFRSIEFGSVPVDDSAHTRTIEITNSGLTNTLEIAGASVNGANA
ncbi:MAG: hypothetical protein AAF514_24605, partial [Verrucomicrobiota bacterium]